MGIDTGATAQQDDVLVLPPQGAERRWFCFHTRPRREKKVARACAERDIRHYLPLQRSVKHYGNRRREHTKPYFSGYIFALVGPSDRADLLCTGHIANELQVPDQRGLLDDLREIRRALEVSQELETFPYITRGQRVRVTRGPFRGIEGVVSERRGTFRVVLNIEFIQRALAIELDADAVEPL